MLNTRFTRSLLVLSILLGLSAVTVAAAPAAGSDAALVCANSAQGYPLGVDGGLIGMRAREAQAPDSAIASATPRGVDGGLLSLLFAPAQSGISVASAVSSCSTAFRAAAS